MALIMEYSLKIIDEWQPQLRQAITSWEVLANLLELQDEQREEILRKSHFPLKMPIRLVEKVKKGTLDDPILKQFLPLVQEEAVKSGCMKDPVGDGASRMAPRLLHKYQGRLLLMPTGACAMHCRYCFRRHFDYGESDWEEELTYIESEKSIREVILSGGDPLSLPNYKLERLLKKLEAIGHLKKVRFHTRFPIAIPERIDAPFLEMIASLRLQVFFVIHCNHPLELGSDLFSKLRLLQRSGATLLCQSVLLKGVNDDAAVLKELFEELTDNGVLPYYLHQLDRVEGASHFEVDESVGLEIMEVLRQELPGYAVPKYVKEIKGMPCKQEIKGPDRR